MHKPAPVFMTLRGMLFFSAIPVSFTPEKAKLWVEALFIEVLPYKARYQRALFVASFLAIIFKAFRLVFRQSKLGDEGLDNFVIVPPFASEADKIREAGVLSTSNISLLVLGGVGLAAVGFISYNLLRK